MDRKGGAMRRSWFGTLLMLVVSACAGEEPVNVGETSEVTDSSPLTAVFDEAAEKYGVPADLLKALAYVETQLEPATGEIEFEGQAPSWGYFGLAGDELAKAAAL